MLLNAVIIILREVLEASLIISVFLAFSQTFNKPRGHILWALLVGFIFAAVYAVNIATVSNWFEGVGQEVMNASIQLLIYVVLLAFVVAAMHPQSAKYQRWVSVAMIVGVVLATIREGSEIILYIYGFASIPELLQPVLLGSAIGAGIGISVGVCFYYLLVNLSTKNGARVGYFITLLVAAGMVSQSIQLLIQADWVMSQYPVWNTSNWISEYSITGQLLYALIGYESTPTAIQVGGYLAALFLMISLSYISRKRAQK